MLKSAVVAFFFLSLSLAHLLNLWTAVRDGWFRLPSDVWKAAIASHSRPLSMTAHRLFPLPGVPF